MKCPCHSGKQYEECCAPYHQGGNPPTPLALMRSRYSAYALKNIDYIIQTTHPTHPDSALPAHQRKRQIKEFCTKTLFTGLDILESTEDSVTFRAHLTQNGEDASFIEKSAFAQVNERWCYLGALRQE